MKIDYTDYIIDQKDLVSVNECGNITEVTYCSHLSRGPTVTKLTKDLFVRNLTGEVCEYEHSESRADNFDSVRRSLKKGRDRINTNCTEPEKIRWITLTYAENMQDPERLYLDCKPFFREMRNQYGDFEYIAAVEPQARGAWHMHIIAIFPDKAPYLDNKTVAQIWQHGFVNIKAVDNVDNIGAYFSAYMCDLELEDGALVADNVIEHEIEGEQKKFIKGARLKFYPPGMNMFRYSKGIKKPKVTKTTYEGAQSIIRGSKTYEKLDIISGSEDSDFAMIVKKEYYNAKR